MKVGTPYPAKSRTVTVGKYVANWDKVERYRPFQLNSPVAQEEVLGSNTLFYTPDIANSPGRIAKDIGRWRADMRLHIWEQDLSATEAPFSTECRAATICS